MLHYFVHRKHTACHSITVLKAKMQNDKNNKPRRTWVWRHESLVERSIPDGVESLSLHQRHGAILMYLVGLVMTWGEGLNDRLSTILVHNVGQP